MQLLFNFDYSPQVIIADISKTIFSDAYEVFQNFTLVMCFKYLQDTVRKQFLYKGVLKVDREEIIKKYVYQVIFEKNNRNIYWNNFKTEFLRYLLFLEYFVITYFKGIFSNQGYLNALTNIPLTNNVI